MRFHFITVPIHGNDTAELELNQFLATHRVIAVDRQLVADGARSAWAICITYVDPNASAPALTGRSPRTRTPSPGGEPSSCGTHPSWRRDVRTGIAL